MNGGERRGRDRQIAHHRPQIAHECACDGHHGDLRATPQGPSMIHRVPLLLGLPCDREADGLGAHELQAHPVVEPEMHSAVQRFEPLKPLATRAFILYVLLRLLLGGIGAAGARLGAASPDSPAGIVLLVAVLGAIDIRRRGESLLWANLGYSTRVTWGLFGAVALSGELFLFMLRS